MDENKELETVNEVETGVEPDKNIEIKTEEVKEPAPVATPDINPAIEEYANKYDAMVKENEELKGKLAESDSKYAEMEATIKTLQEGMAKLRKANEFASSSSSIQQNQRVNGRPTAEDIRVVRNLI
jgi:rhamnose utilization protein RhaD (predicted bifunctional aldolase and dehydrogenase)